MPTLPKIKEILEFFSLYTSSFTLSFLSLIVISWYIFKKIKIENKKTEEDIKKIQIENLIEEVKLLSEELNKTRKQLSDLHEQYIETLKKLREANEYILKLEFNIKNFSQKD